MKAAIIERESRPVRAMNREEGLEHIWSSTHENYRGYAGTGWRTELQSRRTVLVFCGGLGTVLKLLDDLTGEEIAGRGVARRCLAWRCSAAQAALPVLGSDADSP